MPTENQLFDEIAAAGINIDGLATDEGFKNNHRGWWRQSGGIMLERLSKRLSSVAAPGPSSQSKNVAAGRALNTADTVWVVGSSELADFVAALSADDLTKALAWSSFASSPTCATRAQASEPVPGGRTKPKDPTETPHSR